MSVGESVGYWNEPFEKCLELYAVWMQKFVERLAFDIFHRYELVTAGVLDGIDDRNVRVVHRGGKAGFVLKTSKVVRVFGHQSRQGFQGDKAVKLRVLCQVHL